MALKKSIRNGSSKIWQKWSIAIKILPLCFTVAILKFLSHDYGFELMELNTLFTTLIAGTIFLLGFLMSGVHADYKESEKIPSELSGAIKSLHDDAYTIFKSTGSQTAEDLRNNLSGVVDDLLLWFYRKESTKYILNRISEMNEYFIGLEKEGVQVNYIIRLKNEQDIIRNKVLRIDTIRDTEFVGSAYAIVEAMGFVIALGLIIIKIEPMYGSLFFAFLVTFLISYMFLLIKDLDNPFDYLDKGEKGNEISLKPIHDLNKELEQG